jgi:1-acyl-sn-glycerol-3-phosphate acyltransferase
MDRITQILLHLQDILGRLTVVVIGPLMIIALKLMRYRVNDLGAVRKKVRKLFETHRGPWIICPNHLTMIDSVILAYAMVPLYRYILRYRLLPWNLPEQTNFQTNIFLASLCYLAKCIPINRGGDRKKMKATLEKCCYLLKQRESIMIFPEGGRSRTGRVDTANFSYGVGRLISTVPDCRVMCIYMRGKNQTTYSNIHRFGEQFTLHIDIFKPDIENKGLKAQRDCARQIVEQLARMEEDYFEPCGQRHCGPDRPPIEGEKPGYAFH